MLLKTSTELFMIPNPAGFCGNRFFHRRRVNNRGYLAFVVISAFLTLSAVAEGPYAPAAGEPGSDAVYMHDESIHAWATGHTDYIVGLECDEEWQTPEKALGPADGIVYEVVSLGRGGRITMTFDEPIVDGPGNDFAVFGNAFSNFFLELAYCEVSSDGVNFVRFLSHSLTPDPVPFYGAEVDPTNLNGLAGKYQVGYGTPFDLGDLDHPKLDKENVRYVRLVDIVGDGTYFDSYGNPIYDPYPTEGSAGFDLDAVAILRNDFEEVSIKAVHDFGVWGGTEGSMRITRKSWDVSEPLDVTIEITGTATNGTHYEYVPATFTIPANEESARLSFVSLVDALDADEKDVIVAIHEGEGYIVGRDESAEIAMRDRPINIWKRLHFGDESDSARADDHADWSGDGTPNLIAYTLGLDPTEDAEPALRISIREDESGPQSVLSFVVKSFVADVELLLKSRTALNGDSPASWEPRAFSPAEIQPSAEGTVYESVIDAQDKPMLFRLEARRL